MTPAALRHHIAEMTAVRHPSNAHVIDPAIRALRAALARQTANPIGA